MALLQELDTGTPIRIGDASVTLTIDGRCVSVPRGTSVMAAAALIDNPIPKLCATDSLEAFGSCRLCLVEIEGRRGTPASCTTPAEEGMVVRTRTVRLEKLRRGVMELYISDHPLDCLTCSANGDCELQTQAGNVGLRDVRYGYKGANHLDPPADSSNPYFTFEPSKCIVCSRCVRACEEVQGTFALTILGRGFRFEGFARRDRLPVVGMRLLRRLRSGLSDGDAEREAGDRKGNARAQRGHHMRLLRRRLRLQGRTQGRRGPAHGPLEGRQGQRRPFLRQGALRLWLRHPPGPRAQAHDPQADRGSVAGSILGRGARSRGERIQAHPGAIRTRRRRRDLVVALHQRGGVPGPEAGAHGLRQQQHRHLCARLPLADRLRPVENLRHVGRNAGLQVGRHGGRRRRDRRQPDRRPPGVRLAPEEAPARGRPPHRHRSAPHRPRAQPAYRGRTSPGAQARHERRSPQCARARRRHRRPDRHGVRRRAVRSGQFRRLGSLCRRAASCARGGRGSDRRRSARTARGRPALCDGRKRRDLLRPRRHRARARLDRRDGDRQSRHGDRQYRPGRRRGEPAARPEQRAGLLRHGLVPARILGLPPRLRRRHARDFRAPVGRSAEQRAGPAASPT